MANPNSPLWGLSVKHLSELCGVSEKTAARWKDGTTCPPKTALMVILGDLGCFAPEWRGWIVRGANLVSPEGWEISVNDVLASPLLRQQLALYQGENRALKAVLQAQEFPEEQPLPGAESAILAEALKLLG